MTNKPLIFITAFSQVFLVCFQTYQIAHGKAYGIFVVGFAISFLWTFNVQRTAFGTWLDRIVYSVGAAVGSVGGVWLGGVLY